MPSNLKLRAAQLLENAACVLQLPGWWTKHAFARAGGSAVDYYNPKADCFCAVGGLQAGRHADHGAAYDEALRSLQEHLGGINVTHWNDTIPRRYGGAYVARTMLEAADRLRAGQL